MTSAWFDVRVVSRAIAARDILSLVLEAADGSALPPFDAGAHVDLQLPNGLVRQYSLCNAPAQPERYQLGILLEPNGRGGSLSAHQDIREGDLVRISPPRNLFPLVPAPHALLLAGGIGITPILSMAEDLGARSTPFELHYCVRSPDRAAFRERLQEAPFAAAVNMHFDDLPETMLRLPEVLTAQPAGTHLYVCGPGGFIDFVTATARAGGWPDGRIHLERFASEIPSGEQRPFEIEIAGTGKVITVPADQSAAAALAAAGVAIPLSCEQGICGTCAMEVLSGIPDHRDMYLSDEERAANDCFTPCCSRAHTPRLVVRL
ncbi:PDR/VanB family oxidoreductase [Xanthobacter flavus]|uniref:PDR/VanB family oxidoreductase n=1 Tax=Xanthobacter flavus TaxID=281 RepID=UPI0037271276